MRYHKHTPNFPIEVSVSWKIYTQEQADQLSAMMIEMEIEARKHFTIPGAGTRISEDIRKARRRLQEQAGLVVIPEDNNE